MSDHRPERNETSRDTLEGGQCPQCAELSAAVGAPVTDFCRNSGDVLIEEELEILAELRKIKTEFRQHREALDRFHGEPGYDLDLERDRRTRRIEELRLRWRELDERLKEANRLKWIRLGYLPPA